MAENDDFLDLLVFRRLSAIALIFEYGLGQIYDKLLLCPLNRYAQIDVPWCLPLSCTLGISYLCIFPYSSSLRLWCLPSYSKCFSLLLCQFRPSIFLLSNPLLFLDFVRFVHSSFSMLFVMAFRIVFLRSEAVLLRRVHIPLVLPSENFGFLNHISKSVNLKMGLTWVTENQHHFDGQTWVQNGIHKSDMFITGSRKEKRKTRNRTKLFMNHCIVGRGCHKLPQKIRKK